MFRNVLKGPACILIAGLLGAVFESLPRLSAEPEGLLAEVRSLVEKGGLNEAERRLLAASQDRPSDPLVHNLLGVVRAQMDRYEAAESSFQRALELAPSAVPVYENLGRLYLSNAHRDREALGKAIRVYRRLLQYAPDSRQAHYELALLLVAQGDYEGSLTHLQELPSSWEQSAQMLAAQAGASAGLGRIDEARAAARRLAEHRDADASDLQLVVDVVRSVGKDAWMSAVLEKLREHEQAPPDLFRELAGAYERSGHVAKARDLLENAFRRDPESSSMLVALAEVAYREKNYRQALSYLAHARDLSPDDDRIHFFFGIVCVELNLPLEAKASFRKATELRPDQPAYRYALAAVLALDHDPSEAIEHFKKYRELRPSDPRGMLALGSAYFQAGELDQARSYLMRASKDSRTAAGAFYLLGRIAKRRNQFQEAAEHLQAAVERGSGHADSHAHLGHVHVRLREYEKAEEHLRKAVQLDPDNYFGNLNLLLLYKRLKDPREAGQAERFELVKQERSEAAKLLWRTVEARPPHEAR